MTFDDLATARRTAANLRASHPHLAAVADVVDRLADEVERRGAVRRRKPRPSPPTGKDDRGHDGRP